MRTLSFILSASLMLGLSACKPPASNKSAAVVEAPAAEPSAGNGATPARELAGKIAGASDAQAFAGTFSGTLPCASCPGIDTRITLATDGSFTMEQTYLEEENGKHLLQGSWSAEADGQHVRLDPADQNEDDHIYELLDHDQIRLLDAEGKHIESDLPYNLIRQ